MRAQARFVVVVLDLRPYKISVTVRRSEPRSLRHSLGARDLGEWSGAHYDRAVRSTAERKGGRALRQGVRQGREGEETRVKKQY